MNLKETLIGEEKTRWLDIGCGGVFEEGFQYLDTFPEGIIDSRFREQYHRIDILNAPTETLDTLGKFDFIRMQHVIEHFSYEEGFRALKNIARLLSSEGYLVITAPDLRIHIRHYEKNDYREWKGFQWWAEKRIPHEAPASMYFSIFAHSMPFETHRWCYDAEGLIYQLSRIGEFTDIHELKQDDALASEPFTHNRPEEDVCVIARKL